MMRGSNREMRRMLDKMGLDMTTMDNVEEVIIKTDKKELYLVKPQVIEMKGKDSTIFRWSQATSKKSSVTFLHSRKRTSSS
jgi:nascent polypeptide-associated complex subunit alpha